jgi:hypothetical protein
MMLMALLKRVGNIPLWGFVLNPLRKMIPGCPLGTIPYSQGSTLGDNSTH